MSFILDALKKSESDRQRQSGPALFEVKVAPPRSGLPGWALAIVALLVVNLGIVGWVLLRHPAAHSAEPSAAPAAAAATAPAPAPAAAASAAPQASLPAPAPPTAGTPPAAGAAGTAPAPAASPPSGPAAGAEGGNPEDYAPAAEPAAGSLDGRVRRGTASGVPLYQDAAATPGVQIPQLKLDLHVYADHPQERFVMVNMHKLREGDSTPEGVRVESITPDGVIMSYNGSRFMLPRQ